MMATHRTRPKKIEDVTAIRVCDLAVALGAEPESYIVHFANGTTRVMSERDFEAEYEAIPPPQVLRRLTPNHILPYEEPSTYTLKVE
jgi:hypothetical protein